VSVERALTIRQPWASAIFLAGKDIENRSRPMRGAVGRTIAIHASAQIGRNATEALERIAARSGVELRLDELPRGAIVGVVRVVAIVETSTSPWFEGRYGLELANPVAIDPIGCLGRLQLWRLDDALVRAVHARLAGDAVSEAA